MVVLVAAETNEREGLLAFLEAHRGAVRRSVHGLTEEQARATPTASSLSLGGLLKHVATCEQHWTEGTLMGRELTQQPWADQHRLLDGETVADWLKQYEEIAAETDRIIRALPDLETDAAWRMRPGSRPTAAGRRAGSSPTCAPRWPGTPGTRTSSGRPWTAAPPWSWSRRSTGAASEPWLNIERNRVMVVARQQVEA